MKQDHSARYLTPDWTAPPSVRAWISQRGEINPDDPFSDFNTANHVGDNEQHVLQCRAQFLKATGLTRAPQWLRQVHGTAVVEAQDDGIERTADAAWTSQPGQICTLHTADCLPVFMVSRIGNQVALAHAGWRGLLDGILQNTLACFADPADVQVWLGPAIGQVSYQVGDEVRTAFTAQNPHFQSAFAPDSAPDKWRCDLYSLARQILSLAGVVDCGGGQYDTFTDPRFFSYRRTPVCGRILSAIWIDPAQ